MTRRTLTLLGIALLAGCGGGGSSTPAPTPGPTPAPTPITSTVVAVDVYTNATLVSTAEVQQWAADLNLQFARDISPVWGVNATFTLVGSLDTSHKTLLVEDHITQFTFVSPPQGCHDNATAYVDVYQSQQNGTPEATAGKEVIEIVLGRACTGAVAPYAYPVTGVNTTGPQVLHDWELPAYFTGDGKLYDWMGILKGPGTIAPGGLND